MPERDETGTDVRRALGELVAGERLAVLATADEGGPYTSLVGFAASADFRFVYFATMRRSRKFSNIEAEPRVSLLIDDRSHSPDDFRRAKAASALGRAAEAPKTGDAMALFRGRHPYLVDFVESPGSVLVGVDVERWLVVRSFGEVAALEPGGR